MNAIRLRWAGYAGLAAILTTYVLYLILKDARATSPVSLYSYIPFIPIVICMVWAVFQVNNIETAITTKDAIATGFVIYIIAIIFYTLFVFCLYHLVDKNLKFSQQALTMAFVQLHPFKENMTTAELNNYMSQYTVDDFNMPITELLKQMVLRIFFGFFVAAAIALLIKLIKKAT
jgi:glycopeptide antibiotics resistance protein